MKVILTNKEYAEKVNFVDDNNRFVGYDLSQCCCEQANWFIDIAPQAGLPNQKILEFSKLTLDFPGYNFDPYYFTRVDGSGEFDEGGMVIFRVYNGVEYLYIHLYNVHNGYYSHGFEYQFDKEAEVKSGSL